MDWNAPWRTVWRTLETFNELSFCFDGRSFCSHFQSSYIVRGLKWINLPAQNSSFYFHYTLLVSGYLAVELSASMQWQFRDFYVLSGIAFFCRLRRFIAEGCFSKWKILNATTQKLKLDLLFLKLFCFFPQIILFFPTSFETMQIRWEVKMTIWIQVSHEFVMKSSCDVQSALRTKCLCYWSLKCIQIKLCFWKSFVNEKAIRKLEVINNLTANLKLLKFFKWKLLEAHL